MLAREQRKAILNVIFVAMYQGTLEEARLAERDTDDLPDLLEDVHTRYRWALRNIIDPQDGE